MKKVAILSSVHLALDNRVFYREARSLQKAGYDVTLIAVHDQNEVQDGVKIVALPQVRRWLRPLLWLKLLRLARATKADIYHFHDPELLLVTPWLRWLTGKPIVYDVHEVNADFIKVKDYMPAWLRYPLAWLFSGLEPLLARLQSGLIFADDEIAKSFSKMSCPKITLFNFPERSFIKKAMEAISENQRQSPTVLYLGGMERNRGSSLMLVAFQEIQRQMPEAHLLLVGHFMPPNLEQEMREGILRRGLENAVTISGRVPFTKIGHFLRLATVGWVTWQPVPKNQKNIPTKLFEYMSYGLPIISSDLPSTRPFVFNGQNGFRVTADDPIAHAEAILALFRQPQLGQAMGQKGLNMVQTQYNWDLMEQRLWQFYEELLG